MHNFAVICDFYRCVDYRSEIPRVIGIPAVRLPVLVADGLCEPILVAGGISGLRVLNVMAVQREDHSKEGNTAAFPR